MTTTINCVIIQARRKTGLGPFNCPSPARGPMSNIIRMQHLFLSNELQGIIRMREQQYRDRIDSYTTAELVAGSLDNMVAALADMVTIEIPFLDENGIEVTEVDGQVPFYYLRPSPMNFDQQGTTQGLIYTVHIPFTGPQEAFYYKPPQYPMNMPAAVTSNTEIQLTYAGADLTSDLINKHSSEDVEKIKQQLEALRQAVKPFNDQLPGMIRIYLGQKQSQAQKATQTSAGIRWPIRKRADPTSIPTPPAIRKKIVPSRPASPTADAQPSLLEEHYKQILDKNMSIAMERSPKAFATLEEEHLRFHFLMQLNGQYEGEAMGEAFNYGGQTDILVRSGGHNLFIAECKFWGGEKTLLATTTQLFRYVTWRDTKTAIIMFVKRKSFEGIIDEAQQFMKKHPLYVSGPVAEGKTRFRYIFKHPADANQRVTVTLMLFHVNTES
ncbi:hypothetical protein WKW75_31990 [Bradyrhizobium ottawaense]|uniref:hypothetical protein n=1 Tax=Bradyrhizobium ottawaense TaxID=931866 RepID=UPI00313D74D0